MRRLKKCLGNALILLVFVAYYLIYSFSYKWYQSPNIVAAYELLYFIWYVLIFFLALFQRPYLTAVSSLIFLLAVEILSYCIGVPVGSIVFYLVSVVVFSLVYIFSSRALFTLDGNSALMKNKWLSVSMVVFGVLVLANIVVTVVKY